MSVLINASNLHTGGGLQVGISFLYEASRLNSRDLGLLNVVVSNEVHEGLTQIGVNMAIFGSYEIIDTFGFEALYSKLNHKVKEYELVFTIFGPNYLRVKAKKEIVGFAQLWILNFDNPISQKMSFLSRHVLRTKFYIQWLFFLRADHYVVELEHVKKGLIQSKGIDAEKVSVVYNTVSSLYLDKSKWKSINIEKGTEEISLGIVTRDYPHKNIGILPAVGQILESKYNLKVHFYTTLNELEWSARDDFFKMYVSTVGSLSPEQCPSFYQQIDGVVFPSLLECFSATPLEAMVMTKPLFASDRGFVRDVCAEYALYFDPLDANDIAHKIARYFNTGSNRTEHLEKAKNHALNFSSARSRAEKYLEVIQEQMKG
ncbi:glycosyltransferase [Acinetobacter towneri]|uniref:glycosyltransferase n=1 Tax=Acinetobacter towneri TaxID=202956 RepID=UPI002577681C|nr:glycosyltransferase [Acinetobacter towneri]MDM1722263.1 glycosyltransferase [Acinetobacter towneri]